MSRFLLKAYHVLTVRSTKIHPSYRMSWCRKYRLGLRMFLNKVRIRTGTSYTAHLTIALKILAPAIPRTRTSSG
jgi:hypothetical protein